MSELIINKNNEEKTLEVCILEDNEIVEYYSHGEENCELLGNIYLGIVQNVVDGMQAAFVDIGESKNTFISIKDAMPKVDMAKEELVINKNMSDVLKKGDKILVQIRKEPSEEKGARVSTHLTIPGNYVVLMPNTQIITVSQKISDQDEIARLKDIVQSALPEGFGAIIRTDAIQISKDVIKKDIEEILEKYEDILNKYNSKSTPVLLYDDHDIVYKTARDMISKNTEKIYTNDREIFEKVSDIAKKKGKEAKLIETDSLFKKFGLITQKKKIDDRKVWLNCGGYIAIDKTEALTAIDVNSGKYTGDISLEKTALSVNLEAAKEVMKQVRLKDIGGIVIVDFIDLTQKEDQLKVVELMKQESKKDRSKIDIKGYTRLNLVELTRKKLNA